MTRKFASALAMGSLSAVATLAAAVMTCASAYADDITVDPSPFVSTLSAEQVRADLAKPFPGGNPWSSMYNMFQGKSTTAIDQARTEYITSRDEVKALTSEDSGSAFIMKSRALPAANGAAMGAPAR
jgi:hypothetical protein